MLRIPAKAIAIMEETRSAAASLLWEADSSADAFALRPILSNGRFVVQARLDPLVRTRMICQPASKSLTRAHSSNLKKPARVFARAGFLLPGGCRNVGAEPFGSAPSIASHDAITEYRIAA
jgi:hypothetical protein